MLRELKWALTALAVAGAVWLGWTYANTRAENKRLSATVATLSGELKASQALRKLDQAVASRHAVRVATLTTIQKATDAKLHAALAENTPWADQNVPPDVAAAIGLQLPAHP